MSVIAKLSIRSITPFGTGQLVELGCVCENDLMAAYATSEEDKLFTRYSPWGEIKLCQPAGFALGEEPDEFKPGSAFYAMILSVGEIEKPRTPKPAYAGSNYIRDEDKAFPGSYVSCPAVCVSITDFGDGQAKTVSFRNGGPHEDHYGVDRLNWKMAVDNPGATNQLKPGKPYWIVLYPASAFDRNAAIAAAHGAPA
jgi:hypothetical protein